MNEKRRTMSKRFLANLNNWASGRSALIFVGLWLVSAIALQISDQRLSLLVGGETKLDLHFAGYDVQTVQALFDAYGEQGRELYLGNLALDSLMPLFLALATVQFITLALGRNNLVKLLVVVPIVFFLADVAENIVLATLVTGFPAMDPGTVGLASAITRPRLLVAMLTYALLILSAMIIGVRYIRDVLAGQRVSGNPTGQR